MTSIWSANSKASITDYSFQSVLAKNLCRHHGQFQEICHLKHVIQASVDGSLTMVKNKEVNFGEQDLTKYVTIMTNRESSGVASSFAMITSSFHLYFRSSQFTLFYLLSVREMKSYSVTIQMKATERYFAVVVLLSPPPPPPTGLLCCTRWL